LLESLGIAAVQESIGALFEPNASFPHAVSEPEVLVKVEASSKREVRTDADEHPSELHVVQVEIILIDPAVFEFEVTAAGGFRSDADENPSGLSCFNDSDNLIGLYAFEVGVHELVTPVFGAFQNGGIPGK
jgi:hypothetical protein